MKKTIKQVAKASSGSHIQQSVGDQRSHNTNYWVLIPILALGALLLAEFQVVDGKLIFRLRTSPPSINQIDPPSSTEASKG